MAPSKVVRLTQARCIGESPPMYGARKAYAYVTPEYTGRCLLNYELVGIKHSIEFENYQQAVTAATMAIFSRDLDFKSVTVTKKSGSTFAGNTTTAKNWYLQVSSMLTDKSIQNGI